MMYLLLSYSSTHIIHNYMKHKRVKQLTIRINIHLKRTLTLIIKTFLFLVCGLFFD